MAYTIVTPVPGQNISASLFGQAVKNAINDLDARVAVAEAFMTDRPIVRLVQQAAQSLTDNTHTALTFGTAATVIDSHNFHSESTNNTRITPTVAGWYEVSGSFATVAGADYASLQSSIRLNGSNLAPDSRTGPNATSATRSISAGPVLVPCNGSTDYIEIAGFQDNTANTARNTSISGSTTSCLQAIFTRGL